MFEIGMVVKPIVYGDEFEEELGVIVNKVKRQNSDEEHWYTYRVVWINYRGEKGRFAAIMENESDIERVWG